MNLNFTDNDTDISGQRKHKANIVSTFVPNYNQQIIYMDFNLKNSLLYSFVFVVQYDIRFEFLKLTCYSTGWSVLGTISWFW